MKQIQKMLDQKNIIESLKEVEIRPSVHRSAILGYLRTHFTHPTVDDIYLGLAPQLPTLSKTTVYNTLKVFTKAGLILNLTIDKENEHFDGDIKPHAHFICTSCGQITDIEIRKKNNIVPDIDGAVVEKTELSFFGKCKKCITKK